MGMFNKKGFEMEAQQKALAKKTRNRKKIKTAEIKMLIEPKYKDLVKEFCSNNNMTMTEFITDSIIRSLEQYGYLEE